MGSSRQTRSGGRRDPVIADVLLRPRGGRPASDDRTVRVTPANVGEFLAEDDVVARAEGRLTDLGFQISYAGPSHISITGPIELHEEVFGVRFAERSAPPLFGGRRQAGKQRSRLAPRRRPRVPAGLSEVAVGVEYPSPITYAATPSPPAIAADHLEIPREVGRAMDTKMAHAKSILGKGIRLAIVDSGFMTAPHPFFKAHNYPTVDVKGDPADPMPLADEVGHGTAIAACALAVAPSVSLTMYKLYTPNGDTANVAAFARAAADNPHIISCSWSLAKFSTALQLAINQAVARGIVVCFAVGNRRLAEWPASEPAVVAIGGAFLDLDDRLTASGLSSSGMNPNNPGRQVPDMVGIGGGAGGGLIALPTPPGSTFDVEGATMTPTYPGDGTTSNDGWTVFGGTSVATPMVAATAALLMEADPTLVGNPPAVRAALTRSCVDVSVGQSASGQLAGPGRDNATGAGLVQAFRGVGQVDVWMRDNSTSDIGLVPTYDRRPPGPPLMDHWTSPDIRVFAAPLGAPAGEFDSMPAVNPVFERDNYVYMRVRNRGWREAKAVSVKLYFADPGTEMVFPGGWYDGQSGKAEQGSIKVGNAATNEQIVSGIPPDGSVVLNTPFVWRPPKPSLSTHGQTLSDGSKTGNFALLARIACKEDPIYFPAGGPVTVIGDNNIAMLNLNVVAGPVGTDFTFRFLVRGIGARRREPADLFVDRSGLPRSSALTLSFDEDLGKEVKAVGGRRRRDSYVFAAGEEPAGLRGLSVRGRTSMLATLSLELPKRVRPGDYRVGVYQLRAGECAGGLTLVARVIPGA